MAHPLDRITHIGGPSKDAYTYYPVVVIGAGESGICMGARLQQVLGFDQFRVFERRSKLGGTWHANDYPGIACDVPAVLYSYSFAQNPNWTAPFPPGAEIARYLYNVCNRFKILDKIQCDTNVKSVRWMESVEEWELVLEHLAPGVGDMSTAERKALEGEKGTDAAVYRLETVRAKIVASAVGGLVEPKPNIQVPGLESFEGKIIHTARWDHSVDLKDKDVTVVGTGCSSAQVMAQLVKPEYGVKSVTQLLRSPPWVVPFLASNDAWNRWVPSLCRNVPGFQQTLRKLLFAVVEQDFVTHFPDTDRAREGRKATAKVLLKHMRRTVPKEYHEILTPNYEVYCKRRVIDDGWFKSLQDPRFSITSQPLTAAGPKTITVGPGRHYPPMSDTASIAPTSQRELPCDVLIMANGYATNEWLHPLDITGKDSRSLYSTWRSRGGAQAYLGTAMDGFPNFFMIFGPNTATGHSSVILATENMVNHALQFIQPVLAGDIRTCEIRESAEHAYTERIQRELKGSVFGSGGCVNWYTDQTTGWNSTVYPRTQIDFTLRCMFPRWDHWNLHYTRKGLVKLWLGRLIKTSIFLATCFGLGYTLRHGREVMAAKARELVGLVTGIVVDGVRDLRIKAGAA